VRSTVGDNYGTDPITGIVGAMSRSLDAMRAFTSAIKAHVVKGEGHDRPR